MGFYARAIFPRLMTKAMSTGQMKKIRSQLIPGAKGNILEIGFGTGLNLEFYDKDVRSITAVEPNQGMYPIADKNIAASGMEVTRELAAVEAMSIPSELFDTVVCTWTLCSVERPDMALSEIRRVLKPDGRFLFVEHGRADDPGVRKWQDRLTPIWKHIGDGCHLNRNMKELVEESGLVFSELDKFYMPKSPRWAAFMYRGVAVKA